MHPVAPLIVPPMERGGRENDGDGVCFRQPDHLTSGSFITLPFVQPELLKLLCSPRDRHCWSLLPAVTGRWHASSYPSPTGVATYSLQSRNRLLGNACAAIGL